MIDEKRQAGTEIEVTEPMILAGLNALYGSGAVDDYQEKDRQTVAEIFQAMFRKSRK
ncbi:hypothetical protein [Albidovulum aquaemixtae]|uniref:hypothetical protein n=1 Tax=Albidovulum aquaemixtae TaxID=1542388 RepID=UPI0015E7FB41|nr:hypothetical protein [Defluviimonas aquaemixtae]